MLVKNSVATSQRWGDEMTEGAKFRDVITLSTNPKKQKTAQRKWRKPVLVLRMWDLRQSLSSVRWILRERLTYLPVGKDAHVVSVQHARHQGLRIHEHRLLGRLRVVNSVELIGLVPGRRRQHKHVLLREGHRHLAAALGALLLRQRAHAAEDANLALWRRTHPSTGLRRKGEFEYAIRMRRAHVQYNQVFVKTKHVGCIGDLWHVSTSYWTLSPTGP